MNLRKKVVSLQKTAVFASLGLAGAILASPASAQLNPNPSIFNEPPYNRSSSPAPSAPSTEIPAEMPAEMPEEMPTEMPEDAAATTGNSIVDVAVSNGSFEILTAALTAAGLTDVLSGEGPFTVFAPTDEAFAALPEGTVEELLKPENREALVQILSYHVIPGQVTSDQLSSGEVATVAGPPVNIMLEGDGVMVNNATVVQPDVMAGNGVIHVVDQIILPPNL